MARKRNQPAPLSTITRSHLEHVIGGRIAVAKGPDPSMVRGLKSLTEGVSALGQKQQADAAGKQQMVSQVTQRRPIICCLPALSACCF